MDEILIMGRTFEHGQKLNFGKNNKRNKKASRNERIGRELSNVELEKRI